MAMFTNSMLGCQNPTEGCGSDRRRSFLQQPQQQLLVWHGTHHQTFRKTLCKPKLSTRRHAHSFVANASAVKCSSHCPGKRQLFWLSCETCLAGSNINQSQLKHIALSHMQYEADMPLLHLQPFMYKLFSTNTPVQALLCRCI